MKTDSHKRSAILAAALHEFAAEGLAGARTDAIARAARVNKALIHYYFADKETLYGATLDYVFSGLHARVMAVLRLDAPPRQKLLAYVETHFDYVASVSAYPQLVQGEMLRPHGSPHIRSITEKYMRPISVALQSIIQGGIDSGDFRRVDPSQAAASMVAIIVFYFTSRPLLQKLLDYDPLDPPRLADRRAAVLDFISAAMFAGSPSRHSSRRSSASPARRPASAKKGGRHAPVSRSPQSKRGVTR